MLIHYMRMYLYQCIRIQGMQRPGCEHYFLWVYMDVRAQAGKKKSNSWEKIVVAPQPQSPPLGPGHDGGPAHQLLQPLVQRPRDVALRAGQRSKRRPDLRELGARNLPGSPPLGNRPVTDTGHPTVCKPLPRQNETWKHNQSWTDTCFCLALFFRVRQLQGGGAQTLKSMTLKKRGKTTKKHKTCERDFMRFGEAKKVKKRGNMLISKNVIKKNDEK